jgi:hypothetical protein
MTDPIENDYPVVAVAVLRELAGERTRVPSGHKCPKPELDRLRVRIAYLVQHAAAGGTAPRNARSLGASARYRRV